MLTERQQKIYDYICKKGITRREQLAKKVGISRQCLYIEIGKICKEVKAKDVESMLFKYWKSNCEYWKNNCLRLREILYEELKR